MKQLQIQKKSWAQLRAFLETRHYIECERNDDGHVIRMSVTPVPNGWRRSRRRRH